MPMAALVEAHSGTVRGTVTDENGVALSEVTITASSPNAAEPIRTTSRSNGTYSILIPELDWPCEAMVGSNQRSYLRAVARVAQTPASPVS